MRLAPGGLAVDGPDERLSHQFSEERTPQFDPFEVVLNRLRAVGSQYRMRSRDSARARCPAHADLKPSLLVTRFENRVTVKCFGGCAKSKVLEKLGLRYGDLYNGPRAAAAKREIVATYPYTDLDGVVLAEKVRFKPKTFRWRTPDGTWGLNGASVGLYNLGDLVEAKQVLVVEGEKAVERLRRAGFTATCPPAGAGHWHDGYAETLWTLGASEVAIVADADQPGRRHAEKVATSCCGRCAVPQSDDHDGAEPWAGWPSACATDPEIAPLRVKLVHLPDLEAGEDVVDYLERNSAMSLRTLIANAPYWYPGCDDERRRERRRALTRERVRRYRRRHPRPPRNAPNVSVHHLIRCNAANVSSQRETCNACNAVTQGERTSLFITKCDYREERAS